MCLWENVTYEFILTSPAVLCISFIWIVCNIGCSQDLFKTAQSILVKFPSSFFSMCFVRIQVVHPYSRTNTETVWKKSCLIFSERSDLHRINNLSIEVCVFTRHMLTLLSVDEILLPRYVNWFTNFRGLPLKVEMAFCACVCVCVCMYIYIYIYEVHTISFQTFFVWALLLIVHTWNANPLRSNLLWLQCTCCTVPTTSGSPLVWVCQWPLSQPLSSPQLSHNNSLWA